MVKPEDLRIGNIIIYEATYRRITAIDEKTCKSKWLKYDNYEYEHPYSEIEGIPLTEEWLAKFGFSKSRKEYYTEEACFEMFDDGLHYTAGEGCKSHIGITTVHDLQNIYYSLFKKELEIAG